MMRARHAAITNLFILGLPLWDLAMIIDSGWCIVKRRVKGSLRTPPRREATGIVFEVRKAHRELDLLVH
ncbi:MAG: hypothetical protein ACXW2R_05075, partial [Candidatus Aminicenantales bacterium]